MEERTIQVDGWYEEKTVNSLKEVCQAAEWLKELQALKVDSFLPPEEGNKYKFLLECVDSDLYCALYDLTKLTSKLRDAGPWEWQDRDEILKNGRLGLASVLERYGLTDWLASLGLRQFLDQPASGNRIEEILGTVKSLIAGPRENRTMIYVTLKPISHLPISRQLLDLLEPVTQGDRNWTDFQQAAAAILSAA